MASSRGSRGLILEAARKEFAQKGFGGARVARIAEAASVNKQLIFYYFGSKSGLYEQIARQAVTQVPLGGEEPGGSVSAPGRVRAAVGRLHDLLAARPEILSVLVDPARRPESREAARRLVGDLVGQVREAVSTGQGQGYFRDDADPDLAAVQAVCLCFGYAVIRDLLPGRGASGEQWKTEAGDLLSRGLAW